MNDPTTYDRFAMVCVALAPVALVVTIVFAWRGWFRR